MQTSRAAIDRTNYVAGLILFASITLAAQGRLVLAACPNPSAGPDLIVSDLNYLQGDGVQGSSPNSTYGYSMTLLACNIGNLRANMQSTTNQHPVFVTNFYRLSTVQGAGRFEQIGLSWAAHGSSSSPHTEPVTNPCCTCNPFGLPLAPGCYEIIGTGYQPKLGPRSEINAATGQFAYPFVLGWNQTGNDINKRLQVRQVDMPVSSSSGNLYFGEVQCVSADDALAGNKTNNVSYRAMISSNGVGSASSGPFFYFPFNAVTQRTKSAIQAWQDTDPTVQIVNVDVPNDGRLIVAWKVTNTAPNLYHYEYAIQNLTSDRSVQAFAVPFSFIPGVAVNEFGFHDVNYHSGEPYSSADWALTIANGTIKWAGDTFAVNPNANALRWGTLYNFRFDSTAAPAPNLVNASIRLFKPGTPTEVSVLVQGPDSVDCNGNTIQDSQDIAAGTSQDCNSNGRPDECELSEHDCNANGLPDNCELAGHDCDGNEILDVCELATRDCNGNGIVDSCELSGHDCDANGTLDVCDLATHDCNGNGIVDSCELTGHDCDANGTLDVCELATHDCNGNGVFDACELAGHDCDGNLYLDECELSVHDCNGNGVFDPCELAGHDCNSNGTLDICEVASDDCDHNGIIDSCELAGHDCNANAVLDACEVASLDCDGNGVIDSCELIGHDCDANGQHDSCQLVGNDADHNGVPDQCQPDCDDDGQIDVYEIILGAEDCNGNGVPDTCDTNAPFTLSSPNIPIPDNNLTGIFSSVLYPGGGNVTDVNLTVNITHTAVGNLWILLRHGNSSVVVWNNRCGTFDNLNVTFDDNGAFLDCANLAGTYRPNSSGGTMLYGFNGILAGGMWTLNVVDLAANDTGTLLSWTLNVTSTIPPPPDVNHNHVPDSCECLNCKGDGNQDGRIDGSDIAELVARLVGNSMNHCLDMDNNLTLNQADIGLFITAVTAPNPPCTP